MPSVVHGGSLGRWYEQLCRIAHEKLLDVVVPSGTRLKTNGLPHHGGVYALWWTGSKRLLTSPECNRDIILPGPAGREVGIHIDDDWLGLSTNLPIPLYVGKTADSIAKRIGLHLMLKSRRVSPRSPRQRKARPPTTSCQLRAGIEHMFPFEKDSRSLILDNVGLSYVKLDGDTNAVNRFYLEDLAIGMMRPPLNIDIER